MVKERAHTFLTNISSISSLTSTFSLVGIVPRRAVSNAGRRSPPRLENANVNPESTEDLGLDERRAAVVTCRSRSGGARRARTGRAGVRASGVGRRATGDGRGRCVGAAAALQ